MSYATLFGFLGLPGFRSKLWLYNEATGEFGGIYEWDTVEDADNYDKSYAMKFSHWRSVPGKFRTTVLPQTDNQARAHHGDVVYRLAEIIEYITPQARYPPALPQLQQEHSAATAER